MYDAVIRGGTVVDGTGREGFTGDVAVAGGRIAAVGKGLGAARRQVDADGLLVTPGWVDVHTTTTDRPPGIRCSPPRCGTGFPRS